MIKFMPKRTYQDAGINPHDAQRIQRTADVTNQKIYVVGSRASNTANLNSDWDYILTGNSRQRNRAKNMLAGYMPVTQAAMMGLGHGITNTGNGIDIFQNRTDNKFVKGNYTQVDKTRDYVVFKPK